MDTPPDVISLNGENGDKSENSILGEFSDKITILELTDQIIAIQTILRDRLISMQFTDLLIYFLEAFQEMISFLMLIDW